MVDEKHKPANAGEVSLGRVALTDNQVKNLGKFKDDRASKIEFRNGEVVIVPSRTLTPQDRDNLRSAIVSGVPDTAEEGEEKK